jgi:hypothetical protein
MDADEAAYNHVTRLKYNPEDVRHIVLHICTSTTVEAATFRAAVHVHQSEYEAFTGRPRNSLIYIKPHRITRSSLCTKSRGIPGMACQQYPYPFGQRCGWCLCKDTLEATVGLPYELASAGTSTLRMQVPWLSRTMPLRGWSIS